MEQKVNNKNDLDLKFIFLTVLFITSIIVVIGNILTVLINQTQIIIEVSIIAILIFALGEFIKNRYEIITQVLLKRKN